MSFAGAALGPLCSKCLRVQLTSIGAEPICVVCLERRPTMAISPCGHRCLCAEDARRLLGAACPICRGPVASVLAIFDS